MSFVAIAIGGAAVVGGIASVVAGNNASDAVASGASSAAEATVESTRMQLEEIRRQFDYQQDILLPQIQSQYNAQGAFSDLLGIGGPQVGTNAATGYRPEGRSRGVQDQRRQQEIGIYDDALSRGSISQAEYDREIANINSRPYDDDRMAAENRARGPQYPGSGATSFQRGPNGEFIDPNLDPTRLADVNTLGDTVRGNLLAGTDAGDDPYRNYISDNQMAAETADQDARVRRANEVTMTGMRGDISLADQRGGVSLMDQRGGDLLAEGAAGTGVYGENFQESVGYSFAREEMDRATDRVGSAGGNYGGRAIIEAQRRGAGLANQEYYNWAGGRERDLGRRGDAEARDASRLDYFAGSDIARGDDFARYDIGRGDQFAGSDISRGDTALSGYESQRIADQGRGDQAYQDYLRRREGDAARLDSAAGQEDALIASDRARSDQAYYNYIANLGQVAGFGGGPAATAVNASQAASGAAVGAYAREGGQLSGIYGQLGSDEANIAYQTGAGVNNALVAGANNYATYRAAA